MDEDVHHGLLLAKQERDRERAAAAGIASEAETADAWFKRYLPTVDCGESHRRITAHNWGKWIGTVLGAKPIEALTRDDVENVRDALDRALDAKTIRPGTARNAWSTLTGALKAAFASSRPLPPSSRNPSPLRHPSAEGRDYEFDIVL